MRKRIIFVLAALALVAPVGTATAASKSPKLAKCDGKQRRPANPYGSILPSVDPANGTSTPASQTQDQGRKGVEVFPEKPPAATKPTKPGATSESQVPPISSVAPQTSSQSC